MVDMINDIAGLLTVNRKYLNKIVELSEYSISEAVAESVASNNDTTEIDIGIGTLYIRREGDGIKFKFIPSERLMSSVVDTCKNGRSSLEIAIEETLPLKIQNVYKELI